ncbi:hypothetical protein Tco_0812339 [Tanacetum coccineum]
MLKILNTNFITVEKHLTYSFAFVKKYWGTIQKDLYDFVNLFFASCIMPNGANSSFFTLIPKVNNPIFITDFRLISLIGIHYKIIAKILANRLSKVIDKIVSKEQSAFIAGHLDLVINGALGLKVVSILRELIYLLMVALRLSSLLSVVLGKETLYLLSFSSILVMEDDVTLLSIGNAKDMDNIIFVFSKFYLASVLKINIHEVYIAYG